MTEEEIKTTVFELMRDLTHEGVGYFKKAVSRSNLVFSGELLNSFNAVVHQEAGMLGAVAEISFKNYGRLKDMRELRYSSYMNVDAITKYVEEIGIDKFAFVDGYEGQQVPTVKNAKTRIVNAIIFSRKKIPVIKRKASQQWYNKTKAIYLNVMKRRLNLRLAEIMPQYMKDVIENS